MSDEHDNITDEAARSDSRTLEQLLAEVRCVSELEFELRNALQVYMRTGSERMAKAELYSV